MIPASESLSYLEGVVSRAVVTEASRMNIDQDQQSRLLLNGIAVS